MLNALELTGRAAARDGINLVDRAALPPGYHLRLLRGEAALCGIFRRLHERLDANMGRLGFCRPCRNYRGDVFRDPWHISCTLVLMPELNQLSLEIIEAAVRESEIPGRDSFCGG